MAASMMPISGVFLQADPFIQQADNLQNYNRYAYVLNNPMSYSDPVGFSLKNSITVMRMC